jgi:hypothetical protein
MKRVAFRYDLPAMYTGRYADHGSTLLLLFSSKPCCFLIQNMQWLVLERIIKVRLIYSRRLQVKRELIAEGSLV